MALYVRASYAGEPVGAPRVDDDIFRAPTLLTTHGLSRTPITSGSTAVPPTLPHTSSHTHTASHPHTSIRLGGSTAPSRSSVCSSETSARTRMHITPSIHGGTSDEPDSEPGLDFGIGLDYLSDLEGSGAEGDAEAEDADAEGRVAGHVGAGSRRPAQSWRLQRAEEGVAAAGATRARASGPHPTSSTGASTGSEEHFRSGESDTSQTRIASAGSKRERGKASTAAPPGTSAHRQPSTGSTKSANATTPPDRSEQRREWNRANARKSRARKRFLVDSMVERAQVLATENALLQALLSVKGIEPRTPPRGTEAARAAPQDVDRPTTHIVRHALVQLGEADTTRAQSLVDKDFELIETVARCKPHFLITDPLAYDNPIVFASAGFHELTGYEPHEILGFNCRFLQGRDTDPRTIARLRHAVQGGEDVHAVILNYKKDGTPFWNELFMAPLRNARGQVVHFVGVQSGIPPEMARKLLVQQASLDAAFASAVPHTASGEPAPATDNHAAFVAHLRTASTGVQL